MWGADTGDILGHWIGHRKPIWAVAFGLNNTTLASASSDQLIQLWSPLESESESEGATQFEFSTCVDLESDPN